MPTLQEVLQQAKALPLDEQLTLAEFLLAQQRLDQSPPQNSDHLLEGLDLERRQEHQWLQEHWQEYLGQWVAIEGGQLISAALDGHKVFADARAAGIRVPYVIYVEDPTLAEIGGW
jgi:hypothetical protein